MKRLVDIPKSFKTFKNDFYEEETEFDFEEDILQVVLTKKNLTVDLGWYGTKELNNGLYKLLLIKHSNWDEPLIIVESKSKKDIATKLEKLITTISSNEISF